MSSLAAGNVRRIVSRVEDLRGPSDLLILADDRPAPDGAVVYRVRHPGDIGSFIAALYGNPITAFHLLTTPWDMSGMSASNRQEALDAIRAVSQQWGNSTIDGAHGIANLIANAPSLLPAPRVTQPITDLPIVAVGAGPSTQAMLDDLRTCGLPIVACDAALKPLLAYGVPVTACTPLERLRSTGQKLPADCGNVVFAGSPFSPPAAVTPFKWHTFWPTCDPVFDWYGADSDFHAGTTTGTCAVAVALRLTSGQVYLVGHDLCGGHMDGANVSANLADGFDAERLTYKGDLAPTKTAWLRAKYDLESMQTSRIINAAGHAGYGLRLDGILTDALPKRDRIDLHWPIDRHPERLKAFQARAMFLAEDLYGMVAKAQRATTLEGCGLERLTEARNLDAIAYILRPLYAECSILRRLGRDEADIVTIFQQAVGNIVHTVAGALRG